MILIDRIEVLRREGKAAWDGIAQATEHHMRLIVLTAAAASLALIPLSREVFWGPMAYAMMAGIVVDTALTILFLPALFLPALCVAWYRMEEPEAVDAGKT